MVGTQNKDEVLINDVNTRALIDSDSSIITVTKELLDKLDPKPEIYFLAYFELNIKTAGGHSWPHKGFVRVDTRGIWKVLSMVFYLSNQLTNPIMFGII